MKPIEVQPEVIPRRIHVGKSHPDGDLTTCIRGRRHVRKNIQGVRRTKQQACPRVAKEVLVDRVGDPNKHRNVCQVQARSGQLDLHTHPLAEGFAVPVVHPTHATLAAAASAAGVVDGAALGPTSAGPRRPVAKRQVVNAERGVASAQRNPTCH